MIQTAGSSSSSNVGAQIYVKVSFSGRVKASWATSSSNISMKIENKTSRMQTTSVGSYVTFSPNDELCLTARSNSVNTKAELNITWEAD